MSPPLPATSVRRTASRRAQEQRRGNPRSSITQSRPWDFRPSAVAFFGAGGLGAVLTGSPWWYTVLCLGLTLVLDVVQVVLPRDSADRLQWWQNRRQYLQRWVSVAHGRSAPTSRAPRRIRCTRRAGRASRSCRAGASSDTHSVPRRDAAQADGTRPECLLRHATSQLLDAVGAIGSVEA